MSVYAIGDVQGCYDPLQSLLEKIGFDPSRDVLWFAGDLVNRGPKSLDVLRFVRGLGDAAVVVLGNHDLHLLALASGVGQPRRSDTLAQVLEAPDASELVEWLRQRPFLHVDAATSSVLVHAGVPPQWSVVRARKYARALESALRGDDAKDVLKHVYARPPSHWGAADTPNRRLRYSCAAMTRIRFVTADGRLDFLDKGPPGSQRENLRPWFDMLDESWREWRIVFGHWAALGPVATPHYLCLDSGCVWGRTLSAVHVGPARDAPLDWTAVPCH